MLRYIIVIALSILTIQGSAIDKVSRKDKVEGMLIGSALGDALGGPVEFVTPPIRTFWSNCSEPITPEGIIEFGNLLKLMPYPKDTEPYAQFEPYGEAGTVTDDTRWKMILFNTIEAEGKLNSRIFAKHYWNFKNTIPSKYDSICDVWQVEYGHTMNHVLGKGGYPLNRIWGGIATMAGQMPFIPMAALYSDPEKAYLKTWEINIMDIGYAKDITSAMVAGLNVALEPDATWDSVEDAIRTVDPYDFNNVTYVKRRVNIWMDKTDQIVKDSDGVISKLYDLLEQELNAETWWEAHVPLVVSFAFLKTTNYDTDAALQLCMEFGHDNDSYAQVVGAFTGAMYGKQIFDKEMRSKVNNQMKIQYNQSLENWIDIIETNRDKL